LALSTYEGRVKRKQGTQIVGRLALDPKVLPEALTDADTGDTTYTDSLLDTPVNPSSLTIRIAVPVAGWDDIDFVDNGNGTLTVDTVPASMDYGYGTIDYNSGTINLTFSPALPAGGPFSVTAESYSYLPKEPVMALATYNDLTINKESLIAFDQTYSYLYNSGTKVFEEIAGATWNSDDHDLFYYTNYWEDANNENLLWVCNNIADDPIRYYATGWTTFTPNLDATPNVLRNCRMLIPFKNRLLALNTLEGPVGTYVRHQSRLRWSQNGDPTVSATSWLEEPGKGGYIDAPTNEQIVSAEIVKDVIIVFFERSTFLIRYTGSDVLPFVWERLNNEIGAESTFSAIGFDDLVMAVGEHLLCAATPNQVKRMDEKIRNLVYSFHNGENGLDRVYGIRDFANELALWTYPDFETNTKFPNRVLVFNYEDNNWSQFTDSFTCFGRWQFVDDYTWATLPYETWTDWTDPWNSVKAQSYYPNIIAGNQKGFVHLINYDGYNDASLDIESISSASPAVVTIQEHNLETGDFVQIKDTRAFLNNVASEAVDSLSAGDSFFEGSLANGSVIPATATITLTGVGDFVDMGDGTLSSSTSGLSGTINYRTGYIELNFGALASDTTITATYDYNDINYKVFYANVLTVNTFELYQVSDDNSSLSGFDSSSYAGYTGSGTVSKIDNFNIKTKRFNPLIETAEGIRIPYMDLYLEDGAGSFNLNVKVNEQQIDSVQELTVSPENLSAVSDNGSKHWQRSFINSVGTFLQFEMTLDNYRMTQIESYSYPFALHAMRLFVTPAGRYGVNT